jgi:CheY-like chemotaxis protein
MQRAFVQAEIANPLKVARDGQEAIDYLSGTGPYADREKFPLPILVLLDLKMPRKSGMETLEWIRGQKQLRALAVIIFSSSVQPAEIEQAYALGANAFVTKPPGTKERIEFARMIKGLWLV